MKHVHTHSSSSQGDYATGIEEFTKAIELDPTQHVFFSNRSGRLCVQVLILWVVPSQAKEGEGRATDEKKPNQNGGMWSRGPCVCCMRPVGAWELAQQMRVVEQLVCCVP